MKAVWKFTIDDSEVLRMPAGAQILKIGTQFNRPYAWALVDPNADLVETSIRIFGTGHAIPDSIGEYLGTFFIDEGTLVFHVFAEASK